MILVFVFLLCLHVIITKSAHIIGLVTRDGAVLSSTSGFQQNGVTIDDEYEWICKLKSNVIVGFDVRILIMNNNLIYGVQIFAMIRH